MNYEKKYNEALERARKIHNDTDFDYEKGMMEEIFPELKESEDEKIRKELIGLMHLSYDCGAAITKEYRDKYIAWLEKQGDISKLSEEEQKPVVNFKAEDWYVSKVDGKIYNAKYMEKTPTNQTRKLEIEKAAMSATGIIEQEEWFIKGAEWSDKNPSYISSEKQGEKKTIEWSKEDERIYCSILADIRTKQNVSTSTLESYYNEQISWLKSLKQRYTWKPSEEQIKAIRLARSFVTDDFSETQSLSEKLIELEEQLKKLRDESMENDR